MRISSWGLLSVSLIESAVGCGGTGRELALRRVVLYQNGVGYFERKGELRGDRYSLQLRRHEVGDVLKSMVVIDNTDGRQRAVSAVLPAPSGSNEDATRIQLMLRGQGPHSMAISYAAPTPVWKPSYRVVLPDSAPAAAASGDKRSTADAAAAAGLLQAWAIVNNASGEPWRDVELVLATGAPLSFAVDLQTPHFVARPDGNGRLVQPVATGIVEAEHGNTLLADGSANADGTDSDGDRIPDRDDKCPHEPETYNGFEDEDGCPDRGRVIVRQSKIEILDKIYFTSNSTEIRSITTPIVQAIAAVLSGNPQLTRVEIQGHACASESKTRDLAERRAAAVRQQIVQLGVAGHRLVARGYGADRPIATPPTGENCDRNRRVEFVILQRSDDGADGPAPAKPRSPGITAAAVAAGAGAGATPSDIAGASYYTVSDPVSLPRGASTMVSMLTLRGGTEDVYLFRPDANVRGSERHPLRAARLHIGMALEPGPVSVFARGSFVGEGVLDRMHAGETALVPYALDSAARVEVQSQESSLPLRLLSIRNGEAMVEDETVRTTRYAITPGAQPPARIFLRHARRSGYTTGQLPPETQESADAYLLPHPLTPDRPSELSVTERRSARRQFSLRSTDSSDSSICPYVERTAFPPPLQKRLTDLCQLQKAASRADVEKPRLREQLDELRDRADELRNNLHAIEKITAAGALRADLLAKLGENERRSSAIQKQLIERSEALATTEARLVQALSDLRVPVDEPPSSPPPSSSTMQLVQ